MNCPGAAARRISTAGRFRIVEQFGVLDHDHGVGAARQHAAGRNRGRGAGCHRDRGRMAAGDHFAIEREAEAARCRSRPRCRPRAAQIRRRRNGRKAARRPALRCRRRARGRAHRRARTVSTPRGAKSRWLSKRLLASSAETTSRNCSCRAARRTASISAVSGFGRRLMAASWQRPHRHGDAGGIAFAFGRHQHPAVGLRERLQRQKARAERHGAFFRQSRAARIRRCRWSR